MDPIVLNNEGAVHQRHLFYTFPYVAGCQVLLSLRIPSERIEIHRPRIGHHSLGITHYEERSDRLPLSSLTPDLQRQVKNCLYHLYGEVTRERLYPLRVR